MLFIGLFAIPFNHHAAQPPAITSHPSNSETTFPGTYGPVVFAVEATGKELTFQWQCKLKRNEEDWQNINFEDCDSSTCSTLRLHDVKPSRIARYYRCVLTVVKAASE